MTTLRKQHVGARLGHCFFPKEFGQVDENKDGSLSVEEFMVVYRRLFAAAKERAFQTFNSNNDEGISSEEWFGMVWSGRFDAIAKRAAEFFTEADADGDNVLTLEEYMLHGKDRYPSQILTLSSLSPIELTSVFSQ